MKTKASLWVAIVLAFGFGLFLSGAARAQTATTVAVRNFEVLAVAGNRLIFRDERGTHELTVPDNFRFKVDGQQLSIKDLKAGMKGEATVTTKTTSRPVAVTQLREAVVISATASSMTVRTSDGMRQRFTQSQLDERGIEMIKDGQVVRTSQLSPGDQLTATIVTNEPPIVVTEKEVEVKLAAAEPVAAMASSAASASRGAGAASLPAPSSATPSQQSQSSLLWVLVLLAVAAFVAYFLRRAKARSSQAG